MYDDVRIEVFRKLDFDDPPESEWVDISEHVTDDEITFSRGIMGSKVTDRTARVGSMSFYVYDDTGETANPFYNPVAGFMVLNVGVYVRIVYVKDGLDRCLWYGVVNKINPPQDEFYRTVAHVGCKGIFTKFNEPLTLPTIQTDKDLT